MGSDRFQLAVNIRGCRRSDPAGLWGRRVLAYTCVRVFEIVGIATPPLAVVPTHLPTAQMEEAVTVLKTQLDFRTSEYLDALETLEKKKVTRYGGGGGGS